jgi:hypothetical protein
VAGQPARHELAQRFEIAVLPEVLLGIEGVVLLVPLVLLVLRVLALDDAAESGSDRIDEDEVAEGQPGRLVLHEARGHCRQRAVRREVDPLRPDGAHVEVGGGGTRTAVEDERDRSTLLLTAGHVRDGEDLRGRLLLLT